MSKAPSRYPNDRFVPRPEDHFTFGLWTVGNPGRDPFGLAVREVMSPVKIVHELVEAGRLRRQPARRGSDPVRRHAGRARSDRARVQGRARRDRDEGADGDDQPVLAAGLPRGRVHQQRRAACARSRCRRRCARSTSASSWARRPTSSGAAARASRPTPARIRATRVKRFREAMNFLCEYVRDNGYNLKFALEAKPNEPRGDIFLPTTGHMLAFIYTLDHPEMVGVNPEVAHEVMPGLDFSHAVGAGARGGQAVPHRSQRPEAGPLRSGPALRQRGPEGRLLPGQAARGRALGRHAPLRQPRLPHRGRAGRLGLRLLQHAVVQHPQGQGGALPRRHRDPRDPGTRWRSAAPRSTGGLGPAFKYDKKTAAALKAHAFDATALAAQAATSTSGSTS